MPARQRRRSAALLIGVATVAALAALMVGYVLGGSGSSPTAIAATGDAGGAAPLAATDMFIKLAGIDGESTDDAHGGEIDVLSWSWGLSQSGSSFSGTGGATGSGSATILDISVVKEVDKSSPKLMQASLKGEHIPEMTMSFVRSGGGGETYMTYELTNVIVTSYRIGGSSGDDRPTEQVSFNFSAIKVEYKPQRPDGSLDAPVEASWNLETNSEK